MPEPTTPASPQAGGTGDTSAQAATTTPPTAQAASGKSPEDYERMIAELRKENAGHRTKLTKFETEELARQQAALSDLEKAQKQAEAAHKQIQTYKDQLVLEKVVNAAHKASIIDPELAALAVKDKLEFDDNGMPTNLDKVLEDLVKNKPYLKAAEPGTAQSPARTAPATGANNPGRANTNAPGTLPPGRMTFHDLEWKK